MRILLIRLDKIGDLVSTLPVDAHPALQGHEVRWVIARGLGFLAKSAVPPRDATELEAKSSASRRELERLVSAWKPDLAVSFQAPWWVSWTLWKCRVPVRAGVRSQWHSFLFLNRGLRQKRSEALRHEADYNRELLEYALDAEAASTPILRLSAPSTGVAGRLSLPKSYVVVHPGMAGSARNWAQKNYVSLIRRLSPKIPVLITGTPADEAFLTEIRRDCPEGDSIRWLVGSLSSAELLEVLASAKGVVAPSTGVAHLAASLETRSLVFFSPVRVQQPRRWAPRGEHVDVRVPKVDCPGIHACLGSGCARYDCMETLTVDDALRTVEGWIR